MNVKTNRRKNHPGKRKIVGCASSLLSLSRRRKKKAVESMRGDSFSWIGEASRFAGQQHTDHVFFISFFLITICRTVTAFGQRPSSSQIFSAISSKMESPRSTALSTSLSDDAKTDTSTMGPSDTLISSTTTFPTESLMGPTWSLSDDDDDAEGVSTGERIAFAPSLPDTLIDEKTATDSQKTSSTVSEATTYPPSMEMIPCKRKQAKEEAI